MNVILYDSDCGICTRIKETAEALDWLETMRWIPNSGAEAARYGIPREHLDHSVFMVENGRATSGYRVMQGVVQRLPVTWLAMTFIVAKKPWSALLFAFLLSPLSQPIGQPAYEWVARNRYQLPGSTCDNQIK